MKIAYAKILRMECAVVDNEGTRTKQTFDVVVQNQADDADVASALESSLLRVSAKNATVFNIEVIPWVGGRILHIGQL